MSFVRLDKVKSTAHYESIKVTSGSFKDGQFLNLSKSVDDGEEAVFAERAESGEAAQAILCTAHLDYNSSFYDFENTVTDNKILGRALIFEDGDVISVDSEIVDNVSIGDKVSIGLDGLGFKKSKVNELEIGMCIRKDFMTNVGELTVIRFMSPNAGEGKPGKPGKDGAPGKDGEGKPGSPGKPGKDGVTIASIELTVNEENKITGGSAIMSDKTAVPITIKN